MYIGISLYIFK